MKIKKIIEKYYSGETSLEEEKWLRNALSCEKIKQDDSYIKLIFNAFTEEKTETSPIFVKTFSSLKHTSRKFTFWKWGYITSGIAACLLLAFGVFFYQYEQKHTAYVMINGVRINDEKLAIESVNQQFAEISNRIDKSLEPLRNVEEKERKIKEELNFITNIHY